MPCIAKVADIKMAEHDQQEEQTLVKDTLSVILDRTERIGAAFIESRARRPVPPVRLLPDAKR